MSISFRTKWRLGSGIADFAEYFIVMQCKQSETESKGKHDRFQAKIFLSQPEVIAIFLKYLGII